MSKREAKCRMKAIQEGHLMKDEQRLLDAVVANGLTYARFYQDEGGIRHEFLFGVYLRRTRLVSVSSKQVTDAMRKYQDALAASSTSPASMQTVTFGCKLV